MFLKLFKTNKKTEKSDQIEDTYTIAEMRKDEKIFLLRFKNNQLRFVRDGKYSYQIGISTTLHSNNRGFPTKVENEQLLNMETILEKDLCKDDLAIFVGAITGGGVKEFVFYTGKPLEAAKVIEGLKYEIKHHSLQYNIQKDPNWGIYKFYFRSNN